jgi:hypothetical protein
MTGKATAIAHGGSHNRITAIAKAKSAAFGVTVDPSRSRINHEPNIINQR